jgi:hypothetical protein
MLKWSLTVDHRGPSSGEDENQLFSISSGVGTGSYAGEGRKPNMAISSGTDCMFFPKNYYS